MSISLRRWRPTPPTPHRFRRMPIAVVGLVLAALSGYVGMVAGPTAVNAAQSPVDADDWLGVLNAYRAQSGLSPVIAEPAWNEGSFNHSCWMLVNGIAHDEQPGSLGYTSSGDLAGNNGNVAVSSNVSASAQDHMELWLTGPFHAIGMLRPSLARSAFGKCSTLTHPADGPWKSAATLDVLRGLENPGAQLAQPITFPGDGATVRMDRFIAESPDPRSFCGWQGETVGLPLLVMMPSAVDGASVDLTGPSGPVETCVLHRGNTSGIARDLLSGDNAVVVLPASPLLPGTYQSAVSSTGGVAAWTFTIDPNAQLIAASSGTDPDQVTQPTGEPSALETVEPFRLADSRIGKALERIPAGGTVRLPVAGVGSVPADATGVSANFTVVLASSSGHLSATDCEEGPAPVSLLNYGPGEAVANQALVGLNHGDLCLYSSSEVDVVIDINAYTSPDASALLTTVQPMRIADTRQTEPVHPSKPLRLSVSDAGVPDQATGVLINLTAVNSVAQGHLAAAPCGPTAPETSTVNYRGGGIRANNALVSVSDGGDICVYSHVETDVVVDVTGWVSPGESGRFVPVQPLRLADTRSNFASLNFGSGGTRLPAGATVEIPVAGHRGLPSGADAATVNVTAVGAVGAGWLRVWPCEGNPATSTVNYGGRTPVANGATVALSNEGTLCVTTSSTAHIVLDITGVWGE